MIRDKEGMVPISGFSSLFTILFMNTLDSSRECITNFVLQKFPPLSASRFIILDRARKEKRGKKMERPTSTQQLPPYSTTHENLRCVFRIGVRDGFFLYLGIRSDLLFHPY